MIIIQKQTWHSHTRYIIFDTEGGCVQINLYTEKQDFGSTACIYALWVDENSRRKGIATRLLDRAEEIAKREGHKSITIDWYLDDTPKAILEWYKKRGYIETNAEAVKQL